MSPLYLFQNKLLIKDGALAISDKCCCGGKCELVSPMCATASFNRAGGGTSNKTTNLYPLATETGWEVSFNMLPDYYVVVIIRCNDGVIDIRCDYSGTLMDLGCFSVSSGFGDIQFNESELWDTTHSITLIAGTRVDPNPWEPACQNLTVGTLTLTLERGSC